MGVNDPSLGEICTENGIFIYEDVSSIPQNQKRKPKHDESTPVLPAKRAKDSANNTPSTANIIDPTSETEADNYETTPINMTVDATSLGEISTDAILIVSEDVASTSQKRKRKPKVDSTSVQPAKTSAKKSANKTPTAKMAKVIDTIPLPAVSETNKNTKETLQHRYRYFCSRVSVLNINRTY